MFKKLSAKFRTKKLPGKVSEEHDGGTTLLSDQNDQNRIESASLSILRQGKGAVDELPGSVGPVGSADGVVNDRVLPDLWNSAFERLDDNKKRILQVSKTDSKDQPLSNAKIVKRVIEQTEEKYAEYIQRGLKLKRSKGECDINVHDKAYKIL